MSIFLSILIIISACVVGILSIDNKEHPVKAKLVIGISIAIALSSIWLIFIDSRQKVKDAEEESKLRNDERTRIEHNLIRQEETDNRIKQIVETTSQILEKSLGQTLVIDDVLLDVSGEVTPEGLVLNYRLKSKLKSLKAIWHFNSFDETFGPSFGDDIIIEGLPTDVGENSFIVSTEHMAKNQTIPFEIRGTGPYVRAKCDIILKDGEKFKVDPLNIVSDKVIIK